MCIASRVPHTRKNVQSTGVVFCDHPKCIRQAVTWYRLQILLGYSYIPHTSLIQANPLCVPTPSTDNFDVGSSQNCRASKWYILGAQNLENGGCFFPHTFY